MIWIAIRLIRNLITEQTQESVWAPVTRARSILMDRKPKILRRKMRKKRIRKKLARRTGQNKSIRNCRGIDIE